MHPVPVYKEDERVLDILRFLEDGEARDDIAERYLMKNQRSLDQYMRRRHYIWYQRYGTYLKSPKHPLYEEATDPTRARTFGPRVRKVLQAFGRPGADQKMIARELGFIDHKEMAQYMAAKGYSWSPEARTYVRNKARGGDDPYDEFLVPGRESEVGVETEEPLAESRSNPFPVPSGGPQVDWSQYIPLLQMLQKNADKVRRLLDQEAPAGTELPRLLLRGVCAAKSIQMNVGLKQLVEDFSRDRNVAQRDVVEVALVDFFRKYGYATEVDLFLKTGI